MQRKKSTKSTIETQKKKRRESKHATVEKFTKDVCKKVEMKNGAIKIARKQ